MGRPNLGEEHRRAWRQAYYLAHREEIKARSQANYYANRSERLAQQKQYAAANRPRKRAYDAARRAAHIDELRAYDRARHANDPERREAVRARARNAVSLSGEKWYLSDKPTELRDLALLLKQARKAIKEGRRTT